MNTAQTDSNGKVKRFVYDYISQHTSPVGQRSAKTPQRFKDVKAEADILEFL